MINMEKEEIKAGMAEEARFNADADESEKSMVLADIADLGKILVSEGVASDLIEAHRSLYRLCSASHSPARESIPCRGKSISYSSVCASLERRGISPRLGMGFDF